MKKMSGEKFLFVISGPSAVGKTSIVKELLKLEPSLSRIITCTTRKIRDGELNGVDYFFFDKNEFLMKRESGDFVEFSEVYGNYYGILFDTINNSLNEKRKSILTINWEGFLKIKKHFGSAVCGIFLLPPSIEHLEKRIRARSTDSEEIIRKRLCASSEDIVHANEFEHQVINDDLNKAAQEILSIINKKSSHE